MLHSGHTHPKLFLVSIYLVSVFPVARLGHHGQPSTLTGRMSGGSQTDHVDRYHVNGLQKKIQPRTLYLSNHGGFLRMGDVGDHWCDATLGCLYITDEWYSKAPYQGSFKVAFRALNFLPESRSKINSRFYLHTRDTELDKEIQLYDGESMMYSNFKCTRPTKFIIHGHLDSARKQWVEAMAKSLLSYGDFNVFRVDWGGGSQTVYSQALANTRVVGLELAHLINWLVEKHQVDTKDVHIIGHSLGAHIAGYAGEKIPDLGRITGLDPAGTGFNTMPDLVHLDPSDALFVDVIHSNAGALSLGSYEPMGHLDFFPNGGSHQPGCNLWNKVYKLFGTTFSSGDVLHALRQFFACSHDQSIEFYMRSLHQPYDYVGHECKDYKSFSKGGCVDCGYFYEKCAFMGIASDNYAQYNRKYVKMYLNT